MLKLPLLYSIGSEKLRLHRRVTFYAAKESVRAFMPRMVKIVGCATDDIGV